MSYKIGIAIAIIFVIVVGVVIYIFLGPASIGEPTYRTMANGFMAPMKISYNIGSLTPVPTGTGAGALYIQAYQQITALASDSDALNEITGNADPISSPKLVAIVKLLEKAAPATMSRQYLLFIKKVRLPKATDLLADRLNAIGQMTGAYATSCMSDNQTKEAKNALTALLVFGQRLWQHGLFIDIRTSGLSDIDTAAAGLQMLYKSGQAKNPYEYDAASKLLAATDATGRQWYDKKKIVDVMNPNPGDMANIVRYDQDISWRIEAMLELGIARWSTDYAPRAHAIGAFLERYTKNSNQWISAAAKRAYGMTANTMNQLAD